MVMSVLRNLVVRFVKDLEVCGVEIEDRAIVAIEGDDVDDNFAGGYAKGGDAGVALR